MDKNVDKYLQYTLSHNRHWTLEIFCQMYQTGYQLKNNEVTEASINLEDELVVLIANVC